MIGKTSIRKKRAIAAEFQATHIGTYVPLNIFELAGFAYPVLLLDTGTFKGRALSLLTFTPDGKVTQLCIYEYVVHCN